MCYMENRIASGHTTNIVSSKSSKLVFICKCAQRYAIL